MLQVTTMEEPWMEGRRRVTDEQIRTSVFRKELYKVTETLQRLEKFRQDLETRSEVSEEQEHEIRRRTETMAREWKTETRKMEEAAELQSIRGDEQVSRLNLEVERRRRGLQTLENELEQLRTKAVTSMLDKMTIERRIKKEEKVMEVERRQRGLIWKESEKAFIDFQMLLKSQDAFSKDIEAVEENISRTSNFSRQLEKILQCGQKGFQHQNRLLRQLQQERLAIDHKERTKKEEFLFQWDEEENDIKELETQAQMIEEELGRNNADAVEMERSLSNNRRSNDRLAVILKELEILEKNHRTKLMDIGIQVCDDGLQNLQKHDVATVSREEMLLSDELNVKEEGYDIIQID